MMAGVSILHVPYRSGGLAINDLLGGHVDVMIESMSATIGHVQGGALRALAVTTANRSEALPNIPALSEFLPGYERTFWGGFAAPRNTPTEIITKLNNETNAILGDPKVRARMAEQGGTALAVEYTVEGPLGWASCNRRATPDFERHAKSVAVFIRLATTASCEPLDQPKPFALESQLLVPAEVGSRAGGPESRGVHRKTRNRR
jgi:Tripartite tricarboxylate transporter family receptor